MLGKLRLHAIERMLQPGDQPGRCRRAVDIDRLRAVRSLQRQFRIPSLVAATAADVAGQLEAADAGHDPSALDAISRGNPDSGQEQGARSLALRDRASLD